MSCVVHYQQSLEEARAYYKSNGNFTGPLPLCGNGNFHAVVTRNSEAVNCEPCLKKLHSYLQGSELWGSDPNCDHCVIPAPGGGIKCTKCRGWFCY